jgi:hypothetical protein
MIVLITLLGQSFNSQKDYRNPTYFSSYSHNGYYKIDPKTIIEMLDRGETNVFVPLLENPNQVEDLNNSISWTQAEHLKIASALSQRVWNEPLDLETWKVYFVYYRVGCNDNLRGFNEFNIVYYKYIGIKDWRRVYTTRLIEVYPWMGVVFWGGEAKFTSSLLLGWDHIDLTKYGITSDAALQIAEKNGGKSARLKTEDNCGISVAVTNGGNPSWKINYDSKHFEAFVNPYTGKYSTPIW